MISSGAACYDDGFCRMFVGDALDVLSQLPEKSVHCCVTSPPYFGLRSYLPSDHPDEAREGGTQETPEQYVAWLVEVFRGVWRVLRDDGTLWLNLGDSYNAYNVNRGPSKSLSANADVARPDIGGRRGGSIGPAPHGDSSLQPGGARRSDSGQASRRLYELERGLTVSNLKPKDLLMIPARVALALQQPFYTGRIKQEADRVWLAAAIDSEGCMYIHKRKVGQENGNGYRRKNASYGAGLEISNTSERFVQRCMEITGMGSICRQEKDRKQPLYRWNLRTNVCREVVREVYPYLVAKQHEARLLLGCPSSGPLAEAAHAALIHLHNGRLTDVDFAPPASMFEQGWFLRSAITWCKSNPMPESVTDRPTQATEMVYLLTKKPRYFYDAEAVKEALMPPSGGRQRRVLAGNLNGLRPDRGEPDGNGQLDDKPYNASGRNLRNYWQISTRPYPGSHYATFPPELPLRAVKAGTSEHGVCSECGAPWRRVLEREPGFQARREHDGGLRGRRTGKALDSDYRGVGYDRSRTIGWDPTCCHPKPPDELPEWAEGGYRIPGVIPATVLDPFSGSGTTGLVARKLGRRSVLIDIDARNVKLLEERMGYQGVLL